VYNASSTHHTDSFATAAKAATNMVPVPHLLRHLIKMLHADGAFLPQRRQKVLGGGENSPHQSNLHGANQTRCYIVMTQCISQPHPVLEPYEQRDQIMNKLMVWLQCQAGLPDGAVNFCEGHRKNDTSNDGRVTMGNWLVWGQFLDPNVNQDTMGKL
jgi:hypothetical protein